SITVDRQLKRYGVPRVAFINKTDRTGANPYKVRDQLEEKLGLNSVMMQVPIGLEDKHEGVVDLVTMKALYFDGDETYAVREADIPADLVAEAREKREIMLEAVSMFDDELMELVMEGAEVPLDLLHKAIRTGTLTNELVPVYVGSAYKNKGVQPLLDAVMRYLPSPPDIENKALDLGDDEKEVILPSDPSKPPVALAFKLEDGQYGQLTYIRIYQGMVKKGSELFNVRNQRKFKVGRLVRMHANSMEDISEAGTGDIVALFGIDCASGDTFCGGDLNLSMTSMFVPNPVISLSVKPKDKSASDKMAKALNRFTKEDPTFRTYVDPETNDTIIQGMGELHLEVYVERMRREYQAEVDTGAPQVAYREAISKRVEWDYTHKKQTGGSGQYAKINGIMEPIPDDDENYIFENLVKGGNIPTEYIPSCDKGFQTAMQKGSLLGFPVVNVKMTVVDGSAHAVDSSDQAFQTAALMGFREAYKKADPIILEPIMKVVVEGPNEFQGNIFGSINQRRGMIIASQEEGVNCSVEAEVPLSEMFGYSTTLRSSTQGKAEFTMEFAKFAKVPQSISEELIKKAEEEKKAGK
ncbi:MAG: elongation factor G, partial [Spirochaetaceae bacterium]|nr:elongation factor G [Spirochaetaceae bacterium]